MHCRRNAVSLSCSLTTLESLNGGAPFQYFERIAVIALGYEGAGLIIRHRRPLRLRETDFRLSNRLNYAVSGMLNGPSCQRRMSAAATRCLTWFGTAQCSHQANNGGDAPCYEHPDGFI